MMLTQQGCIKWSANKWLWNKDQSDRGWRGDADDIARDSQQWCVGGARAC